MYEKGLPIPGYTAGSEEHMQQTYASNPSEKKKEKKRKVKEREEKQKKRKEKEKKRKRQAKETKDAAIPSPPSRCFLCLTLVRSQ